jgi:hypothetical protein
VWKKVLLVLLVLFLLYWLVQAPNSFASFTQDAGSWIWRMARSLFESVIDVLDSLGR